MWTTPLRALLLQIAVVGFAALVAPRAKAAALMLGAVAFFGAPWFAGSIALLRGLCALVGFMAMLRLIDIVRVGTTWSASRRVFHVLSVVDSRTLRRAPLSFDMRAFGRTLSWAALTAAGFCVAYFSTEHVLRLGGALVLTYAVIECLYAFLVVQYRAIGFVTPRLHVFPIASLSIGELWGKRWARPISTWLRETCFRPLARRRHPRLGLLLGFVVSAIGHAYPTLVALDVSMAAMMFAFFLVQGVLVIIETRLGVSRWSRSARRVWTVTLMLASSPLFVEPVLRTVSTR